MHCTGQATKCQQFIDIQVYWAARRRLSADLGFTVDSSIFFFCPLPPELVEWNSTKTGHTLGSKCDLKLHVQNLGYPSPYKSGAQKPPFSTISQLNSSFNGIYLRNETR